MDHPQARRGTGRDECGQRLHLQRRAIDPDAQGSDGRAATVVAQFRRNSGTLTVTVKRPRDSGTVTVTVKRPDQTDPVSEPDPESARLRNLETVTLTRSFGHCPQTRTRAGSLRARIRPGIGLAAIERVTCLQRRAWHVPRRSGPSLSYASTRLRQRLRDRGRKINEKPIWRDNQISNNGATLVYRCPCALGIG